MNSYPIDLLRKRVVKLERRLHMLNRHRDESQGDETRKIYTEQIQDVKRSLNGAWLTLQKEEHERYTPKGRG